MDRKNSTTNIPNQEVKNSVYHVKLWFAIIQNAEEPRKIGVFDMSKSRPFWAAELDFKSRETFLKNSMSHCGEKIGYFL